MHIASFPRNPATPTLLPTYNPKPLIHHSYSFKILLAMTRCCTSDVPS